MRKKKGQINKNNINPQKIHSKKRKQSLQQPIQPPMQEVKVDFKIEVTPLH
jgi:hypothetical protein